MWDMNIAVSEEKFQFVVWVEAMSTVEKRGVQVEY